MRSKLIFGVRRGRLVAPGVATPRPERKTVCLPVIPGDDPAFFLLIVDGPDPMRIRLGGEGGTITPITRLIPGDWQMAVPAPAIPVGKDHIRLIAFYGQDNFEDLVHLVYGQGPGFERYLGGVKCPDPDDHFCLEGAGSDEAAATQLRRWHMIQAREKATGVAV